MNMAAVIFNSKNCSQPRSLQGSKWATNCYIHLSKILTQNKVNEQLLHSATWTNIQIITSINILSISKDSYGMTSIYVTFLRWQIIIMENRLVVVRSAEEEVEREMMWLQKGNFAASVMMEIVFSDWIDLITWSWNYSIF